MREEPGIKDMVSRKGLLFVALWSAGILFLYAIGGYIGVRQLQLYKTEGERIRKTGIGDTATELNSKSSLKQKAGRGPVTVTTGIYINRIKKFSLIDSSWAADFDIWFRWTGAGVNPGDRFQIINGEVESREKVISRSRGMQRYERYRVKARLTKLFDTSRFPFSKEELSIHIEDAAYGPEAIRYVADRRDSGISSAEIAGFLKIERAFIISELHDLNSRMGEFGPVDMAARPSLVFTTIVNLPSMAVYLRITQALFVSVAIAFIVFFIRPTFVDPRFGLGIGAVFAAVANNIYVQALLPPATQVTLVQMVYVASLMTIFLTLVQSAIALYILDTLGGERLYRLFDKSSFAVFVTGYTVVNLALPLAAGA